MSFSALNLSHLEQKGLVSHTSGLHLLQLNKSTNLRSSAANYKLVFGVEICNNIAPIGASDKHIVQRVSVSKEDLQPDTILSFVMAYL